MFISRAVMLGVIGIPPAAGGGGAVQYNWAFFAGGTTGTGDLGVTTDTRTYDLGDATWASEGALSTAVFNAAGFGDKVSGWIVGGYTGATNATQNREYTNADGSSMTSAAASTTSVTMQNGWRGAATTSTGYVFGGTFVSTVRKYSISGDSWSAGSALGGANGWMAEHNNATYALISGGYDGSANLSRNDRYTFSDDTRAAQTALGTARRELTATGDQSFSYLYCGTSTTPAVVNTIEKISLTDGSSSTSFTNSASLRFAEAAGSDTKGVFAGGQSATPGTTLGTTREVVYADGDDTAGTALPTNTAQMAAYSGIQVS
jgi:hypothetical protein